MEHINVVLMQKKKMMEIQDSSQIAVQRLDKMLLVYTKNELKQNRVICNIPKDVNILNNMHTITELFQK